MQWWIEAKEIWKRVINFLGDSGLTWIIWSNIELWSLVPYNSFVETIFQKSIEEVVSSLNW